jgi:hypothetical protein
MKNEKRARQILTHPEPTIFGNCNSWSVIVGKSPKRGIRSSVSMSRCSAATRNYSQLIHSFGGSSSGQLAGEL